MGQCLRCLQRRLLPWIGVPAAESPTLAGYRSLLTTYLRPDARLLWRLVALLLAGIVVQIASPLLVGRFFDEALGGAPQSMLLVIGERVASTKVR